MADESTAHAATIPTTLICVVRAAKGVWDSLKRLEADSGGQVIVWQGQAKSYSNGAINAKLFADQSWDDHPGPPPTAAEKAAIKAALSRPGHNRIIVNSFAGENAPDRCLAGEYLFAHLQAKYPTNGRTEYVLCYDGNARDDKEHKVHGFDENGQPVMIAEDNAPGGVYAPMIYKALGVTHAVLIDPHSRQHAENYVARFGKDNVAVLSAVERIADDIVARHGDALRDGTFRIGAPDGWDKKDAPGGNAALSRIADIAGHIWERMPELAKIYGTPQDFLGHIQFGITKIREVQYPGQPARPKTIDIHGDVNGCVCVLADDEVDSGGSITGAAEVLLARGAAKTEAYICHGPTYFKNLDRLLSHTYAAKDGGADFSVTRFTMTNSMARIEGAHGDGFREQLSADKRSRTGMIDVGSIYTDHLRHRLGIAPDKAYAHAAIVPPPAGHKPQP